MKRPRKEWGQEVRYHIEAQGHVLRVSMVDGPPVKGGKRGLVSTFSPASRKRLLDYFARIDDSRAGYKVLITLTYPDGDGPPQRRQASRDLDTFLKRLLRRFPECSGIWRREWEPRKSGNFVGTAYPHYHLLCLNFPFLDKHELRETWAAVIACDYARTEIEGLRSWRQALSYVAKYIAKPEKTPAGAQAGLGRRETAASCSLVNDAYLTGEEEGKSRGRCWGKFNKKRIPIANSRELVVSGGPWMDHLKTWAAGHWPGVEYRDQFSFTLFLDDAGAGFDAVERIYEAGKARSNDSESRAC